ncbi:hypothetical protein WJX72_005373 [[Myrmecia] bisecta]|uniref:Uncharacterized protein n=1 Tax=[Myrmecia] bisecta TaxID=41462 RepID=A0AAW1QQP2_9CHLO
MVEEGPWETAEFQIACATGRFGNLNFIAGWGQSPEILADVPQLELCGAIWLTLSDTLPTSALAGLLESFAVEELIVTKQMLGPMPVAMALLRRKLSESVARPCKPPPRRTLSTDSFFDQCNSKPKDEPATDPTSVLCPMSSGEWSPSISHQTSNSSCALSYELSSVSERANIYVSLESSHGSGLYASGPFHLEYQLSYLSEDSDDGCGSLAGVSMRSMPRRRHVRSMLSAFQLSLAQCLKKRGPVKHQAVAQHTSTLSNKRQLQRQSRRNLRQPKHAQPLANQHLVLYILVLLVAEACSRAGLLGAVSKCLLLGSTSAGFILMFAACFCPWRLQADWFHSGQHTGSAGALRFLSSPACACSVTWPHGIHGCYNAKAGAGPSTLDV